MRKFEKIKETLPVFLFLLTFSLSVFTLMPSWSASEPSILGYKAFCPFSPISTVLVLYASLLIKAHIDRNA